MTSDQRKSDSNPERLRARRRDIIQSLGAGVFLTNPALLDDLDGTDQVSTAQSQQRTIKGNVIDNKGRPVPDTDVTLLEFRQYTLSYVLSDNLEQPFRLLGRATTDNDGQFEFKIDPETVNGYTIFYAQHTVGEETPDKETATWFAAERIGAPLSEFFDEDGSPLRQSLKLDRRLIFSESRRKGAVTIWQDIDPSEEYPHVIHVETRGNQYDEYDPSVVRTEYRNNPYIPGLGVSPVVPDDYDLFSQDPQLEDRRPSRQLFVSDLPSLEPGFSAFRTVISELDVGFHTLQLPESVDVKYRNDQEELGNILPLEIKSDDGGAQADLESNLPPASIWTDNEDAVATLYDNSFGKDVSREKEFLNVTGVATSISEVSNFPTVPIFPLFANQSYRIGVGDKRSVGGSQEKLFGAPGFLVYDRGRREIVESRSEDLLIDLLQLALTLIGFALGGAVAGVIISAIGEELSDIDISKAQNLPDYTEAENQAALGKGQLPVDRREYDLVTGDWRFETYGHVQRFPLRFRDDFRESFCLRGMFRTDSDGDKKLFSLQQAFEIDPTVTSPLEDDGLVVPGTDADDGSAGDERSQLPPSFSVTASDWSPEAGQSVTFEIDEVVTYTDAVLDSVEWNFEPPPIVEEFEEGVRGDEGSRQRNGEKVTVPFGIPGDHSFTVSVTDTRGNTLSREFGIRVTERIKEEITYELTVLDSSDNEVGSVTVEDTFDINKYGEYLTFKTVGESEFKGCQDKG